jgi:hypothetical protein
MNCIEEAKRAILIQCQNDQAQGVAEIRRRHPAFDSAECLALWEREHPEAARYIRRIERGDWPTGRQPVYQFIGRGANKSPARSVREALNLPTKIQARKPAKEDDAELMLVYGSVGEVVDLELVENDHAERLHDATQKILDRHPGPLERRLAEQLALGDAKLADEHESDDELQANQQKIKDWIKVWQHQKPGRLFRDGWAKCQAAHPGWFEVLTP